MSIVAKNISRKETKKPLSLMSIVDQSSGTNNQDKSKENIEKKMKPHTCTLVH